MKVNLKNIQFILLILLSSALFTSCQNSTDENKIVNGKSPVLSISSLTKTTNKVSFVAKASWHNGCGSFSHFTSTKADSTFYITVYGKQPLNATCTMAFIEYNAPVEIVINGLGKYSFKFWQSDTTSVDTTLTF